VTLVSFYPGFFGLNLRQISASLREAGFEVDVLHLGYATYRRGRRAPSLVGYPPAEELVQAVLPAIEGSLYLGVSLTASEFVPARAFSRELRRRTAIPVLWGGPHPTAAPAQSAPHADYLCVGEGEETAVAFARSCRDGRDPRGIGNLAWLEDGELRRNPLNPLVEDLDTLPLYDTRLYEQQVFLEGRLQRLTPGLLEDLDRIYLRPVPDKVIYLTNLTRGCPHRCTYCNNSFLRRIYDGQRHFRRRSLDHLFREIGEATRNIGVVGAVFLADDNITALPRKLLEEFAERWATEVGLPFGTSGSPTTVTREKVGILARTGLLYKFGLGVESASGRMLQLYQRHHGPDRIRRAVAAIEEHRALFYRQHRRPLIKYQFIFDNPYETPEDIRTTLRFISRLPQRDSVTAFHLVIYPGSEIHRQAVRDGLIDDQGDIFQETYVDLDATLVKFWLKLFQRGVPRWLLRLLCLRPPYALFDSPLFRRLYRRLLPEYAPRPAAVRPPGGTADDR
jgi:radical SAM superfamily enzyme YgiQ (UPF0313 family)